MSVNYKNAQTYLKCLLYVLTMLTTLVAQSFSDTEVTIKQFHSSSVCDVDERVDAGCANIVENSRGTIHCAIRCAQDSNCIGSSIDETGRCFIHTQCPQVSICIIEASNHAFLSFFEQCAHGGVWNQDNLECECFEGMSGSNCEIYPTRCDDLLGLGVTREMALKTTLDVYRDGSYLMSVFCLCHPTWCETLALMNAGERDFNKTWVEYRDGFYMDDSHYWIGLENMYILHSIGVFTAMTNDLYFKNGPNANRRHLSVTMNDGNSGYSLNYGEMTIYSRNRYNYELQDCWEGIKHTPFSTWDKDRDEESDKNCAANAGSGWWYTDCSPKCNLLGWASHSSMSKPDVCLWNFWGIPMDTEGSNIRHIYLALHG